MPSMATLRQKAIYREFFRPLGVEHQMVAALQVWPHRLVAVGLNRSRSDFSEQERLMLELLRGHLAEAYRNCARYGALQQGLMERGRLPLTAREYEVLQWVAQGGTNQEVALILGIAPLTVRKHLEHIYGKLGVESRTAAAKCSWEALSSAGDSHRTGASWAGRTPCPPARKGRETR